MTCEACDMLSEYLGGPALCTDCQKDLEKAKENILPEHFKQYRKMKGRLSKEQYELVAAAFIHHTLDIFVMGDCSKYDSRQDAVEGFKAWMKKNELKENWRAIFRSIDMVTPYT